MIHGLNEQEKYKVIRPIIGECKYDSFDMPIIQKTDFDAVNWENLHITNIQNASSKSYNKDTLLLMFRYDKNLLHLWNEPLRKVGLFQSYAAISTPDFSAYPSMNVNEIRHNVYMARWLGKTWQNYGCTVFPTVGWANSDSYDICFSGLEKNSIVVISTLGCDEYQDSFLAGFNEMKRRIEPPLIVVYGKMIHGMTGNFLRFDYTESFQSNFEQIKIEGISSVFSIEEV